ncbi:hypothetical protein NA57DRAFT_57252 [Rhizodiscina lignyota]|uniref:Methyltransferase SirN-like protein n=1 Tax=Rhizodiscina lignyota TaxID=1504668 RepID=A0A9P4IH30_9PEZI|nr:hypothetical protein NA57DRAFT_57252 [Rhizodiscina lignyota]
MAEPEGEQGCLLRDEPTELERLDKTQAVVKAAMNDRLILAPLDLSKPDLCILDSATANGAWLRDISTHLKSPYALVGADIMTSFFPSKAPPHTALIKQDFQVPWPTALYETFDLVHQRAALARSRSIPPKECVSNLTALVKPGGWIQLMEMDLTETDNDGPAAKDFLRLVVSMLEKGGSGLTFNIPGTMVAWLKDAELDEVREEMVSVPYGKSCSSEEIAILSTEASVQNVNFVCEAATRLGVDRPEGFVGSLPERYRQEIETRGGEMRLIVAMGRTSM